jgi:hypothetical protein
MKIAPNLQFAVIEPTKKSLNDFMQMIKTVYQNFTLAFNGNIGFGDGTLLDNINGSWINVVAPAGANTDFTVNHNLNRLPVGYLAMQKDRACDVYTGSVVATKTQLTLRATVAFAVLRLFIIGLLLSFFITRSEAQGASHTNNAYKVTTPSGSSGIGGPIIQPIPGAVITVCTGSTLPSPGATCTGLASIFSDIALTQVLSDPTNADTNGNYFFYATAQQNYVVSVGGIGLTTYSYVWTAPITNGSPASLTNAILTTPTIISPNLGAPTVVAGNTVVGNGIGGIVYNTAPAAGTSSIGAITMVTAPANANYFFTAYATQTVLGTSCTGNTTIAVNLVFQDPNAASSQTIQAFGLFTVTNNGTLGIVPASLSGTANLAIMIRAKSGTVVQFSTIYSLGATCSPGPTVQIFPSLIAI